MDDGGFELMAKTAKVTLGEVEYAFTPLDMGQLEELAETFDMVDGSGNPVDEKGDRLKGKAAVTRMLDNAAIVFRNAAPPIEDVRKLTCTALELRLAMFEVYRLSGLLREPKPGEAEAEARAAA